MVVLVESVLEVQGVVLDDGGSEEVVEGITVVELDDECSCPYVCIDN